MNKQCKNMSFSECELTILRMAVDKAQERQGKRIANSEEVQKIIHIVEDFMTKKKMICYGGTAINNILPERKQFYNRDIEIPDYDFFSPNALSDAKELADIYYKNGYQDVEAKSGQHTGTYKVFVNYIPIADITQLDKRIYTSLKLDAIEINHILYAPPNFLRMSMYLELSRPDGDTSRWEKILKRLILLNHYFPITNKSCNNLSFQRTLQDELNHETNQNEKKIFDTVKNIFISSGVVFFGGYAVSLYANYMPYHIRKNLEIPDFDVLSNDPKEVSFQIKEALEKQGIHNVKTIRHLPIGEIIPLHYEIKVNNDTIAFIYKPIACHSYNVIMVEHHKIKVATIDTMLSFYLAFLYANMDYYNEFLERTLCIAKFLFDVQEKNRLSQKGLLKRFTITCYGHQETLEEIKQHKANKYAELKKNPKKKKEFEIYFLNYKPAENKPKLSNKSKTRKRKK